MQIHNSLCVAGYMRDFHVVTLGEFMSARTLPYIQPLLRARELMQEAVEEHFQEQLHFEFTALFGYYPGAFLSDHYDSTRKYLENRVRGPFCISPLKFLGDLEISSSSCCLPALFCGAVPQRR